MRSPTFLHFVLTPSLAFAMILAGQHLARAHCCHDSRALAVAEQFRSGVHGLGDRGMGDDGTADDSMQADPPDIHRPLRNRGGVDSGISGLGQLHGNNVGNYGAGSLGQRGPGGLGAMTGNGLGPR